MNVLWTLILLTGICSKISTLESTEKTFQTDKMSKWTQGNSWLQKTFALPKKGRGVHLVTDEIKRQVPELNDVKIGLAHIHILHTSGVFF